MLRLPDINVLQATSYKLKATRNKLHKQRAHYSAWELVKISSPWDQQSSSWAPGQVPRGQDGQVVSDKNKYQYIGDFSFLPYTWDIGCKSCVCPKKYRSSIPLSSIYLYLKSGKFTSKVARFLMTKSSMVILSLTGTGSSILDKNRFFFELDIFLNFTRLGRCQSEALQMGQEEGCPSQECLKTRNQAKLRSKLWNHLLASGSWEARGWQQCTRPLQGLSTPCPAQGRRGREERTQSWEKFK